jgi:hypothetical protein
MDDHHGRPRSEPQESRLPPALRDKLAKILGMLGSDHDGEVLAAARRAQMLIKAAHLTWAQIVSASHIVEIAEIDLQLVERCCVSITLYEDYEAAFLHVIRAQLRRGQSISRKQRAWLDSLYSRAMAETSDGGTP